MQLDLISYMNRQMTENVSRSDALALIVATSQLFDGVHRR